MFLASGARQIAVLADIQEGDIHLLWEPLYHVSGWLTAIMGIQTLTPLVHMSRFTASRFWDAIRQNDVNKFHYMGGVINILLAQPERVEDGDNPVTICWGGAAPKGSWLEFERRFKLNIREAYGLSEAGNIVTMNIDGPVGSCGLVQPEYEMWVEGPGGALLPPGEIGQFVIRARDPRMFMLGYFNDTKRTAQTLRDGKIWTGDLGHQDENGCFYFFGRMKDAIRRRGENVSAWEVERAIALHPDVEDAAAIGIASEMGEQDIKLFVKATAGRPIDLDDLARWSEQYLPRYQLPRFIEVVDEFPRGPTHRVQKHLLSQEVDNLTDYDLMRRDKAAARTGRV